MPKVDINKYQEYSSDNSKSYGKRNKKNNKKIVKKPKTK